MGLWSCVNTDGKMVRFWVPVLLKDGWPAVRSALVGSAGADLTRPEEESAALGLAAAIVVGAASGYQDLEMPADVAQWVHQNKAVMDKTLVRLALEAVDRAEACLGQTWGESDEEFGYQTAAKQLREVLGGLH